MRDSTIHSLTCSQGLGYNGDRLENRKKKDFREKARRNLLSQTRRRPLISAHLQLAAMLPKEAALLLVLAAAGTVAAYEEVVVGLEDGDGDNAQR